jgi:hypothetical protein
LPPEKSRHKSPLNINRYHHRLFGIVLIEEDNRYLSTQSLATRLLRAKSRN